MGEDELRFKYGEFEIPVGQAEVSPEDKPGSRERMEEGYVPSIAPASASQRWP